MKIAAVQLQPVPGDIEANLAKHLALIERAADQGADVVFFPELSLTGYEPRLAESLAMRAVDPRLDRFQAIAGDCDLLVGVGMPLASPAGVQIGMTWYAPGTERRTYAKQYLHPDEEPFFVPGEAPLLLPWAGRVLAPAICYESLLEQHIAQAATGGAEIYLASVAKSVAGMAKARAYFSTAARQHGMTVIVANAVGPCDDFHAAGQSAAWAAEGRLAGALNESEEGILIISTCCPVGEG